MKRFLWSPFIFWQYSLIDWCTPRATPKATEFWLIRHTSWQNNFRMLRQHFVLNFAFSSTSVRKNWCGWWIYSSQLMLLQSKWGVFMCESGNMLPQSLKKKKQAAKNKTTGNLRFLPKSECPRRSQAVLGRELSIPVNKPGAFPSHRISSSAPMLCTGRCSPKRTTPWSQTPLREVGYTT